MEMLEFYEKFSVRFKARLTGMYQYEESKKFFDANNLLDISKALLLREMKSENAFLWNALVFYIGVNFFSRQPNNLKVHILYAIEHLFSIFPRDMTDFFIEYFLDFKSHEFIKWLKRVKAFTRCVDLKVSKALAGNYIQEDLWSHYGNFISQDPVNHDDFHTANLLLKNYNELESEDRPLISIYADIFCKNIDIKSCSLCCDHARYLLNSKQLDRYSTITLKQWLHTGEVEI